MEKMDLEAACEESMSKNSMDEESVDENEKMESEPEGNDPEMNESDEDDDEEDDVAAEAEVKVLQASLAQNPYDYSTHLALIAKLQAMGELERLRAARENMSSKYPLSPEIWLSWLRDEIKLVSTDEQRSSVEELCKRAVKDYLSVEVWLEYLQFSIGSLGTDPNALKNIRELFERALTAGGLHVTKGALIWEAFREFESVLLSMVDEDDESKKKEHLEIILNLFRRQLACPLLDMEKTWEEFEEWQANDGAEVSKDSKIIGDGYKRALEKLNDRLPFEEKLASAEGESESLDAYLGYLQYEKEHGDPGRVTVLYERGLTDLSLEASLWLEYSTYVEKSLKIDPILEEIYERATKNVPWCAKIWRKFMRSMEKWGRTVAEVRGLLENALSADFADPEDNRGLWIAYIEYLRRRIDEEKSAEDKEKNLELIRETFNRACEHLAKLFGLQGDPNCVILQYWARTEAIHADDMEKARSLWSDILSQGHSSMAASWLEYISLESRYGDTKHLRKLYQKALQAVKDWPESIANSWMDFERDEGSLEQMEFCEGKVSDKLEKVFEERQKSQQQTVLHEVSGKKAFKRKGGGVGGDDGKWKNLGSSPAKQPRLEQNISKSRDNRGGDILDDRPTGLAGSSKPKIAPPPGFKPPDEEKVQSEGHHEFDDKISVFVSNLDYTATEDEVRETLAPAGEIKLIKLIQDYKGRSKGFGYVQLVDSNSVEQALKLDRTPIKGRPIFVSRCDPDKSTRGSGFKYRCTLEKNKLFVKGLPLTTTKEEVEELFSSYGTLKDVRLVTYRNGHSKGLAYVEFADEGSAGKALIGTDGTTIEDKIISVAISQPPERKKNIPEEFPAQIKSLGGTSVSRSAFGGPKTLLSMIPRNVKAPSASDSIIPGNGVKQPLNNQDFRNMLLNKK